MSTQYCCSICLVVKQAYDFTAWLKWKQLHGEELAGEAVDDECVRTMFTKIRETQQANSGN